ncbi:hypothetical protein H072_7205 [Dactylellina haptotyla CBS 200.50]|uniref:Mid2 domain-containing protein n=1 Tax=Dactylellina haptotyla (strain CBS 200.50) TaxID=1284197 RepID=S8BUN3_DACHA|nr:hypothetical protein H072_7205 [Dactylellina haptotyla CBS 200.50]
MEPKRQEILHAEMLKIQIAVVQKIFAFPTDFVWDTSSSAGGVDQVPGGAGRVQHCPQNSWCCNAGPDSVSCCEDSNTSFFVVAGPFSYIPRGTQIPTSTVETTVVQTVFVTEVNTRVITSVDTQTITETETETTTVTRDGPTKTVVPSDNSNQIITETETQTITITGSSIITKLATKTVAGEGAIVSSVVSTVYLPSTGSTAVTQSNACDGKCDESNKTVAIAVGTALGTLLLAAIIVLAWAFWRMSRLKHGNVSFTSPVVIGGSQMQNHNQLSPNYWE